MTRRSSESPPLSTQNAIFSGAMPEQVLLDIETKNRRPFKRHKLEDAVSVVVASGEEADACTEYVELDTLVRFKHGPVRIDKMKFALLRQGQAQDWRVLRWYPNTTPPRS